MAIPTAAHLSLVDLARAAGYVADHVNHLGLWATPPSRTQHLVSVRDTIPEAAEDTH
jgi:hypothetical protein